MPLTPSSAVVAHPGYAGDVLVGDPASHLIVDRPLAASQTYTALGLLVCDGAYWRPTNAAQAAAAAWVADTATLLGARVRPLTRPVTVAASAGNTGTGAATVSAAATARAGLYQAVCVAAATHAGTFRLIDPTGADLGSLTVAVAGTLGGLTITIADATDFVKGDWIGILVGALHVYEATTVAGDTKTHGSTEPTWPTTAGTVTDDQVTWTDRGTVDDLRDYTQFGVLYWRDPDPDLDTFATGASDHPAMAVVIDGQVRRTKVAGLPAAYTAGASLGRLILEG